MSEKVNHPKHYNIGKFEVIDVIEDWDLNFNLGNAIKYIARCEHKENKVEDLKKAIFYLEREIEIGGRLMELKELFEMQRKLDAHIIKEKGLEGQNLFNNTMLALHVEIGEMANEWRGFKFWSNNQEPRKEVKCHACKGEGRFSKDEPCLYCESTGIERRPLLEEYIDCLHFFLSIAIQKGWEDAMYISEDAVYEAEDNGFDGGITGLILEMKYFLSKAQMEIPEQSGIMNYKTDEYSFRIAWFLFIVLGLVGFGFTWEQIVQAYKDKNKVNHERQEDGY